MKKLILLLLITAVSSWAESGRQYIEYQRIEVLWNPNGVSGTLIIRPFDCFDCVSKSYTFTKDLEVRYLDKKYKSTKLYNWGNFRGDVIIEENKLVAVRYDNT